MGVEEEKLSQGMTSQPLSLYLGWETETHKLKGRQDTEARSSVFLHQLELLLGASLVVQWLGISVPNAGGPGCHPWLGN